MTQPRLKVRFILTALSFFVFIISACKTPEAQPNPSPEPVCGVWLTNVVSEALFSNDNIVETIEFWHPDFYRQLYRP